MIVLIMFLIKYFVRETILKSSIFVAFVKLGSPVQNKRTHNLLNTYIDSFKKYMKEEV